MPNPVIYAVLIEAALFILTVLFLVQPKFVWDIRSPRGKGIASATGIVFLCMTFGWSFILGSLLVMHDMPLPHLTLKP